MQYDGNLKGKLKLFRPALMLLKENIDITDRPAWGPSVNLHTCSNTFLSLNVMLEDLLNLYEEKELQCSN